jgi:hypothetical protein
MGHVAPPPHQQPPESRERWRTALVVLGKVMLGCLVVVFVLGAFVLYMCSQH